jgi:hypothetical protein
VVAFYFDFSAYEFQQGLRAIELMWTAAIEALRVQDAEVVRKMNEYNKHLAEGGMPIGEWEDDHLLWDLDGKLQLDRVAISEAQFELHAATTIALYHHWERHVPNPKLTANRDYRSLRCDLSKSGAAMHDDFEALYRSANYLKHGSSKHLLALSNSFAHRFRTLSNVPKEQNQTWVRKIGLEAEHVNWFIQIVRQSQRPVTLGQ